MRTKETENLSTDAAFAALLRDSHQRIVGTALPGSAIPDGDAAKWLYCGAPFCLLAHNDDPDPRFIYANRAAQARFGYDWETFTRLPSRLSAEAPERDARRRFLDAVARDGFISDYRGIRIARDGRRFWIENVTVWELIDAEGARHGQAARFATWRDL